MAHVIEMMKNQTTKKGDEVAGAVIAARPQIRTSIDLPLVTTFSDIAAEAAMGTSVKKPGGLSDIPCPLYLNETHA